MGAVGGRRGQRWRRSCALRLALGKVSAKEDSVSLEPTRDKPDLRPAAIDILPCKLQHLVEFVAAAGAGILGLLHVHHAAVGCAEHRWLATGSAPRIDPYRHPSATRCSSPPLLRYAPQLRP